MTLNSTRHLEIVRALAQHRHFGRAAAVLGVSQPSLTRSLKHLEDRLGVQLFERHDGVTPTFFGRMVLQRGEPLLDGFSELVREITLAKGLEIGELTVALGPFPAEVSGQKAVGRLTTRYPGLRIVLTTTDWVRVGGDVAEGRADLGFADISEAAAHPDLATEAIRGSLLRFFCRAGHPLARRASVGLDDLLEFPWVGPTAPARIRQFLPDIEKPFGFFSKTKDRFQPRIVVDTTSAAKDIVIGSDALAVAPNVMIEREIVAGLCVALPVELSWMRLNYGFVWKRGRTHSPATSAFMQLVRQIESEIPE